MIGLRIAHGLAMGRARVVGDILRCRGMGRPIGADDVEHELGRLRVAFDETRAELQESARRVEEQFNAHLAEIFRAHEMMLESLFASDEFAQELRGSLMSAEAAVRRVFRRWREAFHAVKNDTLQQRADDIVDIGRKLLRHLEGDDAQGLKHLADGTVLVVQRLLPSDVVSLSARHVVAIVVESLGYGSHAALLVREKSIPTVADFPGILERIRDDDEVLVDASRGQIVISPDASQRAAFTARVTLHQAALARCRGTCAEPASTLDGVRVTIEANLGTHEDAELALDNGADGVGLLRIEQLYLARELPPTEDELLEALRAVTSPLRDKPLTIRLLDIGGDKPVPFLHFPDTANPLLGVRGVRLLLEYPQLAQTQLAALVRLSQEQDIRVLVPMVTLEEDIRTMRELFEHTCAARRIPKRPPFGAMVETPAAALSVPAIAKYVDFLSVGTNDLTQYTLAVGRDDPTVNRYFLDNHVALLRLLDIILHDAGQVPLTLCGELAGREEMIPQLLAMGFRSLSVAPPLIPGIKALVRGLRIASAAQ
ncbi:MAG TPA: phosphoenolpyruvate--protein phosphotransferase [Candidatus Margulisiibacteriota bacterium]|nr:phosphoenolpyruvate--protein phosphotransferase [Candidatus Margulisiibacteriota bacterium]